MPLAPSSVIATRGYEADVATEVIAADHRVVRQVAIESLARLAIDLNPAREAATFRGYMRDGELVRALPAGSHLDPQTGEFVWAPGLGFGGTHHLVFVREDAGGAARIDVDVMIRVR